MARTETFTKLLDRASTPMQTHIILAQLAILRKLDKARLREGMSTPAMLAAMVVATFTWVAISKIAALHVALWLPFGH